MMMNQSDTGVPVDAEFVTPTKPQAVDELKKAILAIQTWLMQEFVPQNTHHNTPVKVRPGATPTEEQQTRFWYPAAGGQGQSLLKRIKPIATKISEIYCSVDFNIFQVYEQLLELLKIAYIMNQHQPYADESEIWQVPPKFYRLIFQCIKLIFNKLQFSAPDVKRNAIKQFVLWVSQQAKATDKVVLRRDMFISAEQDKTSNLMERFNLIDKSKKLRCIRLLKIFLINVSHCPALDISQVAKDWSRNEILIVNPGQKVFRFQKEKLHDRLKTYRAVNPVYATVINYELQRFFEMAGVYNQLIAPHFDNIIRFVTQHVFLGLATSWCGQCSHLYQKFPMLNQECKYYILDCQNLSKLTITAIFFIEGMNDVSQKFAEKKTLSPQVPLMFSCELDLTHRDFDQAIQNIQCCLLSSFAVYERCKVELEPREHELYKQLASVWPMISS